MIFTFKKGKHSAISWDRPINMIPLFKDVGYHMLWDKAGVLSYQFFHYHKDLEWEIITEKGKCVFCREIIAPYKKLEIMVKLKEFTEGR